MEHLKPIISRHWLFLLAGLMWTGVGVMLLVRAWIWLSAMSLPWQIGIILVSVLGALLFYWFMFTKTVAKNICRLCGLPDPVSLFAFNTPKGYILILFMIALGIALRHSSLDRRILAFVYTTMGGTLLLSSLHFYHQFYRVRVLQHPCINEDARSSRVTPCK